MNISISPEIKTIIETLNNAGHEAFMVGGCIRDTILGIIPKDLDVTTSAFPDEIIRIFKDYKIIETGLKHGTVTVFINHFPIEITTYRIDGIYSDNRHPDNVAFTTSLKDDLIRRDFTINALAYSPEKGLVDYFNGVNDINDRIIRAIENPDKRFKEDALRILRGLRFASELGFEIDSITLKSMKKNKLLLHNISFERISSEFIKMLCGDNVYYVFSNFYDIISVFIPEILPMVGFDQNTPYHIYDVFEHTLHSIESVPPNPILRLTMLFHDIGKPFCYTKDEYNIGHFHGHSGISAEIAKKILRRLKIDNNTINSVYTLVKHHDLKIPCEKKVIKRWLNKLSAETFKNLLQIKRADNFAKSSDFQDRLEEINEYEKIIDEILAESECFSIKQLAINGNDLIELGIPQGEKIGKYLDILLDAVIDSRCENTKHDLLEFLDKNSY